MKKKFVSFLIVLMMVLSCGVLSACKNRYNKMEFVVEYAFKDESGKIDQWYTAGPNLSLNFGAEEDKLDIERNNLVFKIEVKNVKEKYIDDINVFDSNSSSSQIVKPGQEFSLDIDGVMQTSVRIYETKSGKETSFRLNIFESLKNITTNKDFKPALAVGQSVDLNLLTTANQNSSVLLFNPVGTNQTAVDYSIVGLGYYNGDQWVQTVSAQEASNVVGLSNGIVSIVENGAYSYDPYTSPILKIKATSKFYNSAENEKSTTFDIYIIEKLTVGDSPVISQNDEQIMDKILYVNDTENEEYKTIVDVGVGTIRSKYIAGVTTANGDIAKYGLNVYVDGVKVDMDAYSNINGIIIQPLDSGDDPDNQKQNFIYEITADDNDYLTHPRNTIRFELTVLGLNYVVETPLYSADLQIEKRSIVKDVTLNGETSAQFTEGKIYATSNNSVSQTGLYLTVDVLPNDGVLHNVLIAATNGLAVSGRGLESITSYPTINNSNKDNYTYYSVKNGTTILVNFKANGNSANQELRFTTLKKGEDGVAAGYVDDYVLPITKVVTANGFEVLSSRTGSTNYIDQTYLVDAEQETNFFLKVRYTGENLALDSIDLSLPTDSGFTFKNGKTSINLKNDFASAGILLAEGRTKVESTTNEYYEIYQIPLKPTNAVGSALVSISAGKIGNYALFESSFTAKSVFVAQSENFVIQTEGQNITKITGLDSLDFDKYAVVNNINLKSELNFGQINTSGLFEQKTVANVRLAKYGKDGNANFSASAVDYLTIGRADSANKFQIWGIQGGKTTRFVATITYYTREAGVISENQATKEFEVASYNNINNIALNFDSSNAGNIVYINSNYADAASTSVVYNAKSELSEPSASITFGANASETQAKTGINKVKIRIFGDDTCVNVYLQTDDGLKLLSNNQILDKLSGNVVVRLVKAPEQSLRYVGLSFIALSFDQETSVSRSLTINFGDYTPSSNIELEGESLKKENGDISINMSFMNVADGGQATTNFNATVAYDSQASLTNRFDDLDYQLFQIVVDDQGNPVKRNGKYQTIELSKAANRLGVNINKIKGKSEITISANKALGGGMFILRLVAQDSYNELTAKYENAVEIFISIADGSSTAKYKISTVDDFNNIANNLNAHYVLTNDIVIKSHKTFESFSGSISGKDIKYSSNGNITETIRKLTITIANGSTETDNAYYGIFEKLTGEASINDLILDIRFANITPNLTDPSKAVYIGGLAGVIETNVKIENVKFIVNINNINLKQNLNNRPNLATDVFVGGVAGEMAGGINLSNSPITISGGLKTSFAVTNKNIYFGGVAGSLSGSVLGSYNQPSDLKSVAYNLGLNIHFVQAEESITATNLIAGGVAGVAENANISGIVAMGQIEVDPTLSLATGFVAGIVGQATSSQISNIAMLGVNICAGSASLNLAGVVGQTSGSVAEKTTINNVKFIGFRVEETIENGLTLNPNNYGLISNVNSSNNAVGFVAGLVAQIVNNTTISVCSVENFADANMLVGGQVFGLAQVVDGAENVDIALSYVNANIVADTTKTSCLLANIATSNSYYIGKFVGGRNAGIAGANNYIFVIDNNGSVYVAASPADSDTTVVLENYSTENVNQINVVSGEKWAISTTKNLTKVGEYTFSLPYLVDNLTLIPTDILANLNQEKLQELKSLYTNADTTAEDNVLKDYSITETTIINYFNDVKNPLNNADNNTYKIADLVDITVVPENAIGTVIYKILRGGQYASIVGGDSIYFKGTSNNDYILVKAYSLFNPDACDYFLFYTQTWFSSIELDGGNLQKIDTNIYQLETHKGFEDIEIDVLTSNVKNGSSAIYTSLFDVDNISEFVEFETTVTNIGSAETGHATKINQISSMFNRLTISSTNNDFADSEKQERITIKVRFNLTKYLGTVICPQVEGEDKFIDLETLTINLNISEIATDLEFTTDNLEGESKENFAFNATLHTGYVGNATINPENNKFVETNANNNIVEFVEPNHDSLLMSFSVVDGQTEFNRLLAQANARTIPELFDIDVFNTFNGTNKTFNYNISLQLKDSYNTRYLTAPIKFAIKIFAKSNPNVDGGSAISLTINQSSLSSSIVMNNYAASSAEAKDNYTHLITSSQVETATIIPGGNGGVLAIHMQPSYAYIGKVTLSSSELFVPSLNSKVSARFEQLVYHTGLKSYIGISPSCEQTEDGLGVILNLASQTDDGVVYTFNGTIYVHVVLNKKFSGLADEIRLTLDVENTDGTHIVKTKSLVTDFLPGVELAYDNDYRVVDNGVEGYLIQQNTTNNIVTLKIYGYQFNANPNVKIDWLDGDADDDNNHLADIDYMWLDKYGELKPNADGSYTMRMSVAVREKITKPFKITVGMSLVANNEIKTDGEEINFYPTDYILNNTAAKFEFGSKLSLALNQSRDLTFSFVTNNTNVDYSTEIYLKLLADFAGKTVEELNTLTSTEKAEIVESLFEKFAYIDGDVSKTFADTSEYFELYTTNYGSGSSNLTYARLKAIGKFETSVVFKVFYTYTKQTNGSYALTFGKDTTYPHVLEIAFDMQFYTATTRQQAFAISSAEQMFDSNGNSLLGEGQNYVLTNDIVVELAKPITTKIASLDGNNKKIIIKNFAVDSSSNDTETSGYYGLFATVDQSTLLYNVVVDYSQFNTGKAGQLVLAYENIIDVVFGGLAAVNNGLIYNCDVVNAGNSNKTINILLNNNAQTNITFGGLVGINNGTITNSRVGRSEFTKIIANDNSQTSYTEFFKSLEFVMGNRTLNQGQGFKSLIGGFVGVNNAGRTISSSYIANTSLYTYSTNLDSKLAGFVAENSGKISYSYVKGLESTITSENVFATGAKIEAYADGNIAGFVYDNMSGANINNSFANIELVSKSAFMAGFVFNNNSGASIGQSYAACTFSNADRDATLQITPEQPFVGADTTGLHSNGTLENCFWYKDTNPNRQFILFEDDTKPQATGLNAANFADTTNLVNYVFVLSNSKNDRDEGIWSFYNNQGNVVKLPELTIANNVAHSFRYESSTTGEDTDLNKYTYATKFSLGSKANPEIVSSVQEFNDVFTSYGTATTFTGYVRFIADIDFASDKAAIQTRRGFVLGGERNSNNAVAESYTSVDGNGMSINNIYLDVGEDSERSVGLFAEVNRAYIKNLNLGFSSGNFSTANSIYSGGLAGRMADSVIINISLNGASTTIQGANIVGGLAGLIEGQSLVYGVSSNLSVNTTNGDTTELFNSTKHANDSSYATKLSYAGGIVGVADLSARAYSKESFNLSYLYINDNAVNSNSNLNIVADFAGGVAGYVGKEVKALRLSYNIGTNNRIKGQYAAGGMFASSVGASVEASKVSAQDTDNEQFAFDQAFATYVVDGLSDLQLADSYNDSLIESYQYGGGLIGMSIGSSVFSCYSKASFYAGVNIGGLLGLDVLSTVNFNYAVPYLNFNGNMEELKTVGGLIGIAGDASTPTYGQIYSSLNKTNGNISYAFSTILLDNTVYNEYAQTMENQDIDISGQVFNNFIGSDYMDHIVFQAYVGNVNYTTVPTSTNYTAGVAVKQMKDLFDLATPDNQLATYNAIFSIWDTKYWNLDTYRHFFPLLTDQRDENYEIIKDANDFNKLKNNPTGSFKIIDDIDMNAYVGGVNFVFDFTFKGVLVGEKSNGETPMVYNLHVAATDKDDAGLFRATQGATFRNIEFSWKANGVGGTRPVEIKNFAGLIGTDTPSTESQVNTKISAIMVSVGKTPSTTNTKAAELFAYSGDKFSTITGFAGLIYSASGTSILNSSFSGLVTATVKNQDAASVTPHQLAGLVGVGQTVELNTLGIINSTVGANQETVFNFTLQTTKQVNFGLLAGELSSTAISGNIVGSLGGTTSTSKTVVANIVLNGCSNAINLAGLVAVSENCTITDNASYNKIIVEQTETDNQNASLNIAGLVGKYLLDKADRTMTANKAKVYIESTAKVKLTNAAACVAAVETEQKVQIIQTVLAGDILVEGNSNIGAVVANADLGADKSTVILLDQVTSNVNLTPILTVDDSNADLVSTVAGGLIGNINGELILANTMNMGKIMPKSVSANIEYFVGGMAGKVKKVSINLDSYSFSLSSILAGGLSGGAIAKQLPDNSITNDKDLLKQKTPHMGAVFGYVNEVNINGTMYDTTNVNKMELKGDIFYSTDLSLVPEDSHFGTNLTYTTLIGTESGYQQRAVETGLWTNTASTNSCVPYITSLYAPLRQLNILQTASNNYVSGLAANPKSNYVSTTENHYYLVSNLNVSDGEFVGIAIGSSTVGDLFINRVAENSALSNIHISYDDANVTRPLVHINYGVIYNCSINGVVTSLTDAQDNGNSIGLMVNNNYGLISHSFNSADITSQIKVGALAVNNSGTISSSYFTGNITIDSDSSSVYGFAFAETVNGYYFNNYAAGNITKVKTNSFGAVSSGSNNFVDPLATPVDGNIESAEDGQLSVLTKATTYQLMSAKNLQGNWKTTLSNGKFNLNDASFGFNFNYPVYDFNQYTFISGSSIIPLSINAHSRETGNGFDSVFEVSHLGVLSSIQGVIANDSAANRSYKLIRDIDGTISVDKKVNWLAVGYKSAANANMFADSNCGFTGIFDGAKTLEDGKVVETYSISNIANNGLFENVGYYKDGNAATKIQNIAFKGEFDKFVNSGALGTTINGNVEVINIDLANLTISSTSSADENSNRVAMLFAIQNSGSLTIENLTTQNENARQGEATHIATLQTGGSGYYAGLLAELQLGKVEFKDGQLFINFDDGSGSSVDGNVVGGLVGLISGTSISNEKQSVRSLYTGGQTTVNITLSNHQMVGGLIGQVGAGSNECDFVVSNFLVKFTKSNFTANQFGGLIGVAKSKVKIETCAIENKDLLISFAQGENRYFGLIAAIIDGGTLTVAENSAFEFSSTITINAVATTTAISSYENSQGFGAFVGKLSNITGAKDGSSFVMECQITAFAPSIVVVDTCNVGGIIGYYGGGTISLAKPKLIKIQGTVNVGGAIGYANAELSLDKDADIYKYISTEYATDGSTDTNKFAEIQSAITKTSTDASNWGGLIGKAGTDCVLDGLANFNAITIQNNLVGSKISNIGGIVGYTEGEVKNCINYANILLLDENTQQAINKDFYNLFVNAETEDMNQATISIRPINVGGIAGKAVGENAKISSCSVSEFATIHGFESVGGIVGYTNGQVTGFEQVETGEKTPTSGVVYYEYLADTDSYKAFNTQTMQDGKPVYDQDGGIKYNDLATFDINKTYYAINSNAIVYGNVMGAYNVGGVVGCLDSNGSVAGKVTGYKVKANVYGNTNVGGAIGFAKNNTIVTNNIVAATSSTTDDGKTSTSYPTIKGILVHDYVKISTLSSQGNSYYFIPTSVGGLIGSTVDATGTATGTKVENNIVLANITSTDEGATPQTVKDEKGILNSSAIQGENKGGNIISTISNFMLTSNSSSLALDDQARNSIIYYESGNQKVERKVDFNALATGFGGLIGSTDSNTVLKNDGTTLTITSNLITTSINAGLGINVGTYYGSYIIRAAVNMAAASETVEHKIALPILQAESNVSGAYNIGGAIGYAEDKTQTGLSYHYAPRQKINVQPNGVGMYVGGVFGKFIGTVGDSGNENETGLTVGRDDNNVNLKISVDNSYFVGGLVGRLEGNMFNSSVVEKDGDAYIKNLSISGSEAQNFGGLVGMLKVGESTNGTTATVHGLHNYSFTINTIENQNYADGEASFNCTESNNQVDLYAQAYYINLDSFNISASLNVPSSSPINGTAGWHKDYTGFRAIQRCIPAQDNAQINRDGKRVTANWDSVSVIYDAGNIMRVGSANNKITYTLYEEEPGVPKLYTKFGIATVLLDAAGNDMTMEAFEANEYKANFPDEPVMSLDYGYKTFQEVSNFDDIAYKSNYDKSKIQRYYYPLEYNGGNYAFGFRTIYNEDSKPDSGSIFEVNGIANREVEMGAGEIESKKVWSTVLGWLGAALVVVAIIIPGCQWYLVVAGVVGASLSIYNFAMAEIYSNQLMQIRQSSINYLLATDQNRGFLASLNSREMKYSYDENGNIINLSSSGYTYEDSTLNKYYVKYSTIRPVDYYAKLYCEVENPNETAFENMELALGCIVEADEVGQCSKPDIDFTDWNVNYGYLGSKAYFLNYLYKDGYYWKCALSGETLYSRTNAALFYTIYPGQPEPLIYNNGLVYVYGKYDDGKYSYNTNLGNHLKYENNLYSLEGNEIWNTSNNSGIENPVLIVRDKRFVYNNSFSTYGKQKGYEYINGVYYTYNGKAIEGLNNGYANFKHYTGDTIESDWVEGVDYVIATYQLISYTPFGGKLIAGNTYYKRGSSGNYEPFTAVDGVSYQGEIYIITTTPQNAIYVINSTTLEQQDTSLQQTLDLSGEYVNEKSIPSLIQLQVKPSSFKNPYHYLINESLPSIKNDSAVFTLAQDGDNSANCLSMDINYYLWQGGYVYKQSTNPNEEGTLYTAVEQSVISDENKKVPVFSSRPNEMRLDDIKNDWNTYKKYYIFNGESLTTVESLYGKRGDNLYYKATNKNLTSTELTKMVTLVSSVEEITYKTLQGEYDTYKYRYVSKDKMIGDMFKIDNGHLCSRSVSYTLNNGNKFTGLMYQISFVMGDEGVVDYNYNMYLSNADYGLYTRYKYLFADNTGDNYDDANRIVQTADLAKRVWKVDPNGSNYSIVPSADSTVVNRGVKTYFVERVMVTLSNNSKRENLSKIYLGRDYSQRVGKITIS